MDLQWGVWFNTNSMNYGTMESDPEVLGDVVYFFGWTPHGTIGNYSEQMVALMGRCW